MDLGSLAGTALSAYTGGLSGSTGSLGLGTQTGGSGVGGTPNSLSANTPVDVTSAGPRYYGAQFSFPGPQTIDNPINPPLPGQDSVGCPNNYITWLVAGLAGLVLLLVIAKG